MRIGEVIAFLEDVKENEGDLEFQSVTGFWIRVNPSTGERAVVPCVGDGHALSDVINTSWL